MHTRTCRGSFGPGYFGQSFGSLELAEAPLAEALLAQAPLAQAPLANFSGLLGPLRLLWPRLLWPRLFWPRLLWPIFQASWAQAPLARLLCIRLLWLGSFNSQPFRWSWPMYKMTRPFFKIWDQFFKQDKYSSHTLGWILKVFVPWGLFNFKLFLFHFALPQKRAYFNHRALVSLLLYCPLSFKARSP